MDILYEDRQVVVCVKPVGVVSQSDGAEDMVALLKTQLGGEIYPVHRLDRNVGGVMVFARTAKAAAALSAQVQNGGFVKRYLAVVQGMPQPPAGEMRDLLFKDSRRNKSFVVTRPRKGTKEALLDYEWLGSADEGGAICSLVRVRLHTGRTHQIRVQFASRKMPLLGDGKYGSRVKNCETALWSYRVTFAHPADGAAMDYSALPDRRVVPWHFFDGAAYEKE